MPLRRDWLLIPIQSYRVFEPEGPVAVKASHYVIALGGEREINVTEGERLSIRLNLNGSRVLNLTETLRWGSQEHLFLEERIPE